MGAIFRREFKAFFTNPVGCVVLAVLYCISGFYFFSVNMYGGYADLSNVFNILFMISMLAVPFLTMRLFSEDKKQKTDQALLTAPTGLTGIVLGKYFATLLLYVIGISITLVFALIIATQVTPEWMIIIGNYVGLAMIGGLIISIGLLISSLTESQIIAALGTLAISLLLMSIDILPSLANNASWLAAVVEFLSISTRYSNFTSGLIQYDDIVFFLTMQALFLFLTVRVLDSRRWN